MELAYGIKAVFQNHLPQLEHGNDGLIFTGAEAPYTSGTDKRMYDGFTSILEFFLSLLFRQNQVETAFGEFH